MKLLFFAERVNLDLFKGDSILMKRLTEGLVDEGNEVHVICHGLSRKVKIHSPLFFGFYKKAFTFPLTSFFSFRKFVSLIEKNNFDAVVIKMPVCSGTGFWFNLKPFLESSYYSKIAFELKKRKIPFFVFVEGITEKESCVSSFMGCSKQSQMNLMQKSNGIICLSELQNKLLQFSGLKKPMSFFPSPIDTKKFVPEKNVSGLNLSEKKINLIYLSSSCDLEDFFVFFDFIKANNCVLYIVFPLNLVPEKFAKEIKKQNLEKKIIFLKGIFNHSKIAPSFDAGLYLKKFGFPFADASYIMKISLYLSCGLPVLVPEMTGPLIQAGAAAINFEKTKKISKKQLNNLSFNARKIAIENLDLEKNIQKINKFIAKNI